MHRIGRPATSLLLGVVLVSCDDLTAPHGQPAFDPPDVRPYVVGSALANLDGAGRFQLPDLAMLGIEGGVSRVRAKALAIAELESLLTSHPLAGSVPVRDALESIHGQPVDWSRVAAGASVFPLVSHLEPLPPSLPIVVRRAYGSRYAIPFFVDGIQVAELTVSALATNVLIEDGRIRREPGERGGGEFTWQGVPAEWEYGIPVTPEDAVRFTYLRTGVKVREVPVLARFAKDFAPIFSRWVVTLERAVPFTVLNDRSVITTDTVHVAPLNLEVGRHVGGPRLALRLFVAAPEQPTSETLRLPRFDHDGNVVGVATYTAPIRSSTPIRLVEVVPRGR